MRIICPKCRESQSIVQSYREKKRLNCPFCRHDFDNPIFSNKEKDKALLIYDEPFSIKSKKTSKKLNDDGSLTKKQTFWIVGIASVIIFLIIISTTGNNTSSPSSSPSSSHSSSHSSSTSSPSPSLYYINTTTYVATSKDNFDIMLRCIMDNDKQALASLMQNGKMKTLSQGTDVYLVKPHFAHSEVRLKGSTQNLFVVNEHITKK